jgi:hypothetical protein
MYNLDEKIKAIMIELTVNELVGKKLIVGGTPKNKHNTPTVILYNNSSGKQMDFWKDRIKNTDFGDTLYVFDENELENKFSGLMNTFFSGHELILYKNNKDNSIVLSLVVGIIYLEVTQEELMKYIDVVSLFDQIGLLMIDNSYVISIWYNILIFNKNKKTFQINLECFFI